MKIGIPIVSSTIPFLIIGNPTTVVSSANSAVSKINDPTASSGVLGMRNV
jgi:hypothetical protein